MRKVYYSSADGPITNIYYFSLYFFKRFLLKICDMLGEQTFNLE
jgi:hypothetical protein